MKKQVLNIGKALSRVEQKQVFGGRMAAEGDGPCSAFVPGTGWIDGYSVGDAQFQYDNGNNPNVTGYCCAHC